MGVRLVVEVCAVVALTITAAGCSSPGPTSSGLPSVSGEVVVSSFDEQLYWAERDGDVSDAQLAALEKAAASDEMSYAEISALLEDTFACFETAGLKYERHGDYEPVPGFKSPDYGYEAPEGGGGPGEECIHRYSYFAEGAYDAQPKAVELRAAAFEAERPQVLACLRSRGAEIEDDATRDEMRQADIALFEAAFKAGKHGYQYCSKYYG